MKLTQLQYLVAICEEGSFTAAAKRVNATQSGLSMQIKDLEERLGVRLFERSIAGVTPTLAGQTLYRRATRILREVSAINNDVDGLRGIITGKVHAGFMPTFTYGILGPVLGQFARKYPLVDVKITEAYSAVLSEEVAKGNIDFAVVPSGHDIPGLRSADLASDVEVFVTSNRTDRSHLEPVNFAECEPLMLVLPRSVNARRNKIDAYIQTFNIPVREVVEFDAMMATLDLVTQSEWTTILPGCLCYPDIDCSARKLHPIVHPPLTVDYVLIQPAAKTISLPAEVLMEETTREIVKFCGLCRKAFSTNSEPGSVESL